MTCKLHHNTAKLNLYDLISFVHTSMSPEISDTHLLISQTEIIYHQQLGMLNSFLFYKIQTSFIKFEFEFEFVLLHMLMSSLITQHVGGGVNARTATSQANTVTFCIQYKVSD